MNFFLFSRSIRRASARCRTLLSAAVLMFRLSTSWHCFLFFPSTVADTLLVYYRLFFMGRRDYRIKGHFSLFAMLDAEFYIVAHCELTTVCKMELSV